MRVLQNYETNRMGTLITVRYRQINLNATKNNKKVVHRINYLKLFDLFYLTNYSN